MKESTVRGWVKQYRNELPRVAGELSSETPTGAGIVEKLCEKKRGRPLLIGEDLESQVQEFIREVRASVGVINTAITLAAAIDYKRPMDMKLISATVCMLVSRPYVISVDHSLKIHPFKTLYAR